MNLRLTALITAALLLLCSTGCSDVFKSLGKNDDTLQSESNADTSEAIDMEYPVTAKGATLESRPGKVISLSPSITEKLCDLGLEDRLEGISDYCDELESFSRIRCGTAQLPDIDAIEKISPHLLLTETALAPRDISTLEQLNVQIAIIPRAATVDELKDNYSSLAILFEGEKTGTALGDVFNKRIQQRLDTIAANALTEPKNAIYLRLLNFTVATGDTLESALMEQAGLNNIAKDYTDWVYPEDDANSEDGRKNFESIDYIYCDKRSVTMKMLEKSAFYKGLNAVRKDYYLYIDTSAFERQTMRMFDELERMEQYAKGEIPGSKDELQSSSDASAA